MRAVPIPSIASRFGQYSAKERLARALGYEIAGNLALHDFDGESTDIETWLNPEKEPKRYADITGHIY